ncbi:MAG: hypothetical protein SPK23_01405 [Eubacteriales bacterium]|nr:hypothetical protein [Eubacteriales bacterium]
MIKQYDRVELVSGQEASIVEVLAPGKLYVADIDKDQDTYTDFLEDGEIKCVKPKSRR